MAAPQLRCFNPDLDQPPAPSQKVGKTRRPLQFPRCLSFPIARLANVAVDRGCCGLTPLQKHIVLCGFPRSGTTLLQAMLESCVRGLRTFGCERRADECIADAFRNHSMMLTKRPSDIFLLDKLRQAYQARRGEVLFIVMVRDPRAVLTSVHAKRPLDSSYVSVERWRAVYEHVKHARNAPDVLQVRYEDLIQNTCAIQRQIERHCNLETTAPFSDYFRTLPVRFDALALNGVRPLDTSGITRWRQSRFRAKIRHLVLHEMPELGANLIELGYERDELWLSEYCSRRLRRAA